MNRRIEFIESYRKIGNDYQWSDNHGELVRCKDCKHFKKPLSPDMWGWCKKMDNKATVEDWYCADGDRKEQTDE